MPKVVARIDPDELLRALTGGHGSDDVDTLVLDTAGAHLVEAGVADFEVDVVAERSGIGRSTIYRRFAGRNALMTQAVAHEVRRFFRVLAAMAEDIDDPAEQAVAAFAAGLRAVRDSGLLERIHDEPLLLRLLTVESGPIIATATDQLVIAARTRFPDTDEHALGAGAELLIRLAISFVVAPGSRLDLSDDRLEDTLRDVITPLLDPLLLDLPGGGTLTA